MNAVELLLTGVVGVFTLSMGGVFLWNNLLHKFKK